MPILWTDQHTAERQARLRQLQTPPRATLGEWASAVLPWLIVALLVILAALRR